MTWHDKNGGELRRREAQKTRSEAALFAQTNPMELKEQDRWLLELNGGKYARGNVHYNDICYFIAASRAAIRAGKKVVKRLRSIEKISHKNYVRKAGTKRQLKRCSESTERSGAAVRLCWPLVLLLGHHPR